jgi:hypothetical protein
MYVYASTLRAAVRTVFMAWLRAFFSRKYVESTSSRPRPHPAASYPIHYVLGNLRIVSMAATFNNPQINIKWQ